MVITSAGQGTKSEDVLFQMGAMVDRNPKEWPPEPDPDEVRKKCCHWVTETRAGRICADLTPEDISVLKGMDCRNRLADRLPEEIAAMLGLPKGTTYSFAICKASFQFEVQIQAWERE